MRLLPIVFLILFLTQLDAQRLRGTAVTVSNTDNLDEMDMSGDGNHMIVGDWNGASGFNGVSEVYQFVNAGWELKGSPFYGTGADTYNGDVSISNDGSNIFLGSANGAMVLEFQSGDWVQRGKTLPLSFGRISKNGSTIVNQDDSSSNSDKFFHVYKWRNGDWEEMSTALERMGASYQSEIRLSHDGSSAAILQNDGKISFYNISNDEWIPKWNILDTELGSWNSIFGFSASENLETIVISHREQLMVFKLEGNNWNKEFEIETDDAKEIALSADGNKFVYWDKYSNNAQGVIYLYHFHSGAWYPVGMGQAGLSQNANLGTALSISDDGYLVGSISPRDNGNGILHQWRFDDICGRLYWESEFSDDCSFLQPYDSSPFDDMPIEGSVLINPGMITAETDDNGYWFLESLPDGDYSLTSQDSQYQNLCNDTLYFNVQNNRLTTPPAEWAFNERMYDQVFLRTFSDRNDNCIADGPERGWRNVKFILEPGSKSITSSSSGIVNLTDLYEGSYTLKLDDPNHIAVCDSIVSFEVENLDSTIVLPGISLFKTNKITGRLFYDPNLNCFQGVEEEYARNIIVKLKDYNIYANTDENGQWTIEDIPLGDHQILTVQDSIYLPCDEMDFEVQSNQSNLDIGSVGLRENSSCIISKLNVSANVFRPCFSNRKIYIRARNEAVSIDTIREPFVKAELDDRIRIDSCTHEYRMDSIGTVFVDLENLAPGESDLITFYTTIDCDAEVGATLCGTFTLLPVDTCMLELIKRRSLPLGLCSNDWDGSDLNVSVNCNEDSILFAFKNLSDHNMECFRPYSILKDNELILQDSLKLMANEEFLLNLSADRHTYRLVSEQHPRHPGLDRPVAQTEDCGFDGVWTPGLIDDDFANELNPHVDVLCRELTLSFDPNDKKGFPEGVGEYNCIEPNELIHYRIRFQNTGNDTAFNVFITDTLDTSVLDMESFDIGLASHPMTYKITGRGNIRFDFENILLPDSTTNEPASNGFVEFTISQQKDLEDWTIIENEAAIYFDFNEPVITNKSKHTVLRRENKLDVSVKEITDLSNQYFSVFPNPTENDIRIISKAKAIDKVNYKLTNIQGEVVMKGFLTTRETILNLPFPSGLYFFFIYKSGKEAEVHSIFKSE